MLIMGWVCKDTCVFASDATSPCETSTASTVKEETTTGVETSKFTQDMNLLIKAIPNPTTGFLNDS